MNKKLRELLAKMEQKHTLAKGYMDGENKDVAKASELMDEVAELQKEYNVELSIYEAEKALNSPSKDDIDDATKANSKEVDGFVMIAKMLNRQPLNEIEK